MIGDEKTALFVIISDTDDTFNFIVSIMYTQLFNLLCDRADDVYHGRLLVMCAAYSMSLQCARKRNPFVPRGLVCNLSLAR